MFKSEHQVTHSDNQGQGVQVMSYENESEAEDDYYANDEFVYEDPDDD